MQPVLDADSTHACGRSHARRGRMTSWLPAAIPSRNDERLPHKDIHRSWSAPQDRGSTTFTRMSKPRSKLCYSYKHSVDAGMQWTNWPSNARPIVEYSEWVHHPAGRRFRWIFQSLSPHGSELKVGRIKTIVSSMWHQTSYDTSAH